MTIRSMIALGGLSEVLKIILSQLDTVPSGFWEIAKDFPILILFLGSLYYLMRWGERMLEAQRLELKEIYQKNQEYFSHLLNQIDLKQEKMESNIAKLTSEISILRGTISELAKVDDVIDRLLAEIRKQ